MMTGESDFNDTAPFLLLLLLSPHGLGPNLVWGIIRYLSSCVVFFFVYKTGLIARLAGFCDLIKVCMTNELIAAHTTWRFQCAREQMLVGIHLEANGPFECCWAEGLWHSIGG